MIPPMSMPRHGSPASAPIPPRTAPTNPPISETRVNGVGGYRILGNAVQLRPTGDRIAHDLEPAALGHGIWTSSCQVSPLRVNENE
jgi:hypothetical protein